MDQDYVGPPFPEHMTQANQNSISHLGKVLSRLHEIQIVIRLDIEKIQNLIQHLAMLGRYAYAGFQGAGLQGFNHRGHFNRFRPCSEYC